MVDIRVVTSKEDLRACLEMRRIVFIEEQAVSEHEEVDGDDPNCTHLLVTNEGMNVGAARFQYIGKKAKIQRVCILKSARGKGLGAELMGAILNEIRKQAKAELAVLGAQTHALEFYEKLGFEAYGDEYLDAGIAHMDMKIIL